MTLTGVGGCGKTRLAVEVAERERSDRDGEVYFADLSPVSEFDDVVLAASDAIKLPHGPGDQLARVVNYLVDSKALLILDNCEHVIDACAAFAAAVLGQSGVWRILATSRELLAIAGEQNMPVPPMSTVGDESAIDLFETRAIARNPHMIFDDAMRRTVAELCERLDGLPLAIELAAARSLVMSPGELLERLDAGLDVLSTPGRRQTAARTTLEATIDWSYRLLNADEQDLLAVLGVFRGPFDVTAAASVADMTIECVTDLLESLVSKSLVVSEIHGERTSFRLLDTIRTYAQQLLRNSGRMDEARGLHLAYYRQAAATSDDHDWGWLRPNIEAAIDVAIERQHHDVAVDLFFCENASHWQWRHSLRPTLDRLDTVMSRLPTGSPLIERLRRPEMELTLGLRDIPRLETAVAAAIEAEDQATRFVALVTRAGALTIIDPDEALRFIKTAEELDVPAGAWVIAKVRADVHMFAGEYQQALNLLMPFVGERLHLVLVSAATNLLLAGLPSEALELVEEEVAPWALGAPRPQVLRGFCHLELDRRSAAEREFLAEARPAARGGEFLGANDALIGLAGLAAYDGDVDLATRLLLGAGLGRWYVTSAMGQRVADRLGVRSVFDGLLRAPDRNDATELLRATMASGRW